MYVEMLKTIMRIIGLILLHDFQKEHADVRSQIDAWISEVKAAKWKTPQEIKRRYNKASFLEGNHVVFDIKGNKYRWKVKVNYKNGVVQIMNVGNHEEYMKW